MGTTTMLRGAVCATILLTTAMAAAAGQALSQSPVEIPLSARAGHMVVPVRTADGNELTFLVSTGSAVTVLSESGAARVGGQALTLGGVPVNMEDHETLYDASLTVDGQVMDGLVGNNTLSGYDVLFDVPGGRLVLKPFGRAVEWPGVALSEPVRLRIYHGVVLALDVKVQGHIYPAMLELGAPALLVNEAVLRETGITDGSADSFELGATTFHDVPDRLSDHPVIARFSPRGDGFVLVGTPPVLECAIAISWVHSEIRTCAR